jgi:hypothetical protein
LEYSTPRMTLIGISHPQNDPDWNTEIRRRDQIGIQ